MADWSGESIPAIACWRAYIKDKSWNTTLWYIDTDMDTTINDILSKNVCISNWITSLSSTIWWTPLSNSTLLGDIYSCWNDFDLYDVTPLPEYDLIKIMHNWNTYNIADTRCDWVEELLAEI